MICNPDSSNSTLFGNRIKGHEQMKAMSLYRHSWSTWKRAGSEARAFEDGLRACKGIRLTRSTRGDKGNAFDKTQITHVRKRFEYRVWTMATYNGFYMDASVNAVTIHDAWSFASIMKAYWCNRIVENTTEEWSIKNCMLIEVRL